MKKACLVKGGNFVSGIEERYILSRQHGLLPREAAGNGEQFFHLGSLLAGKICERPEPSSVFLRLHTKKQTFFLLVDQVLDEIELPDQTTRLPPPSPDLAARLFPQVAVSTDSVVLLLDPEQVIPVARQLEEKLGQGIGVLPVEYCLQTEKRERDEPINGVADMTCRHPKKEKTAAPSLPAEATEKSAEKAGAPVFNKRIRRENKRPKSVNEETFKRVMAWTIAQFKQGRVGPEDLAANRLPPGLVQQEGLSDTVLQYLIDQISLRCQESIMPSRSGEQHGA